MKWHNKKGNFFIKTEEQYNILSKKDYYIGTGIALILMSLWLYLSSGRSLIATFVPGIIFTWMLYSLIYFREVEIPKFISFIPWYLLTLAVQFIHFAEEFATDFKSFFPMLYGGEPYSNNLFMAFNMISYFVFLIAPLLVYFKGLKFLLIPMLFYIVYGALGNAISHVWWSIYLGKYFPGLYTGMIYWLLSPILLMFLLKSKKKM